MVRTRTRCNQELLEGSSVRHIATATIGFDHIDNAYCRAQNIEVSTAAGCNARAVLQWVGAVLAHLSRTQGWQPQQKTLGIVGVGNVGSLIEQYATEWGFKVVCCDPPRAKREGGNFLELSELLALSDIVTLHTPLDSTTHHMINAQTLQTAGANTLIINSSRGEVIDTQALLDAGNPFVMDVWENEPNINPLALQRALLATPHIAGYSLQGKANAATIAVRNIAQALGLPLTSWCSEIPETTPRTISWEEMTKTIDRYFDIVAESNQLKADRELFEQIRNEYQYRDEFF